MYNAKTMTWVRRVAGAGPVERRGTVGYTDVSTNFLIIPQRLERVEDSERQQSNFPWDEKSALGWNRMKIAQKRWLG